MNRRILSIIIVCMLALTILSASVSMAQNAAEEVPAAEDSAGGDWTANKVEGPEGEIPDNEDSAPGDWTANKVEGPEGEIPFDEDGAGGDWTANQVDGAEGRIPENEDGDSTAEYGDNLTEEAFRVGDLPEDYLKPSEDGKGTVECVYYKVTVGNSIEVKSVLVYLPAGYEESEEPYNIIYLLHAADGSPNDYLDTSQSKKFQRLLDHMIADGVIDPVIVAAPTYFPSDSNLPYMPLAMQVTEVADFPEELVSYIIPAVEGEYRTYAEATDEEGITASRDHRAVAGFSLGGIVTWDVLIQKLSCARWFLPISECSWDDGNGGIDGLWDSSLSAEVLYEAVKEQGYGADDFILFVATGTEDVAFDIATSQMVSLLEYDDMFITGKNTSCSMLIGGTHSQSAIYTYMYHIMPSLFHSDEEE